MGVSGSGKTTIGKMIADRLDLPFYDGDDYHPEENKKKMQAGQPLTDEDRYPWLLKLNALALNSLGLSGCVIACSALKESYRDLLMKDVEHVVRWIFLEGSYDIIHERIKSRTTHFMPSTLLNSQFDILESPAYAIRISIDDSPEEMTEEIIARLEH